MLDTRNSYLEVERPCSRSGLLRAWLGQGGAFAVLKMVLPPYSFGVLAALASLVSLQAASSHISISRKSCLAGVRGAQAVACVASRDYFGANVSAQLRRS